MNLEELNKTQIVLLTLLVSFITSIATGIVTVSLIDQAPPGFTQTVNRVVERTVEKVVPTQVPGTNTVTKETTVVVKEEDLITTSIDSVASSIVSIRHDVMGDDGTPRNVFLGWGMLLSTDGLLSTDSSFVSDGTKYEVITADEKVWKATPVIQDESRGVAILKIEVATPTGTPASSLSKFKAVKTSPISGTRLGQTVIAFGGTEKRSVAVGIIGSFITMGAEVGTSTPQKKIVGIEISPGNPVEGTGGPLATIFGEVVGMKVGKEGGRATYVPIDVVKEIESSLSKTARTDGTAPI